MATPLITDEQRAALNPEQRALWEDFERLVAKNADERRAAERSPVLAAQYGMNYSGPNRSNKGEKNGACNRAACQLPLLGAPQFWIKNHTTGGRLYYCGKCANLFAEADRRFGEPLRCTPDGDNP